MARKADSVRIRTKTARGKAGRGSIPALSFILRSLAAGGGFEPTILKLGSQIDQIDEKFAHLYGLSAMHTEFMRNYDIKYRLAGADDAEADGDE